MDLEATVQAAEDESKFHGASAVEKSAKIKVATAKLEGELLCWGRIFKIIFFQPILITMLYIQAIPQ
ncbi:MAG: hypothetical protein P8046_14990 [Anaerolineales bacterium]